MTIIINKIEVNKIRITSHLKKLRKEESINIFRTEDIIKLFLYQVKNEPLTQILNIGYRREFLYKKANELINKHKSTVNINAPISKVIELLYKEGFQYIPILDKNKKVMGVVTPSNLIDLLQKG